MSAHALARCVTFEVADPAHSARLAQRLALRWNVTVHAEPGEFVSVVAELRPETRDLVVLLREVESWVEEESVRAVRYELDGRFYVLEAGDADWDGVFTRALGADVEARRVRLLDALSSVDHAIAKSKPRIRGLEGLREDLNLALRLLD